MPRPVVVVIPGAGVATVGSATRPVRADSDGGLHVGDLLIRPISFGARWRAAADSDPAGAVLFAASGTASDAAWPQALALHLAGVTTDGHDRQPADAGFAAQVLLISRRCGWSPTEIFQAPAGLIDQLCATLAPADPVGAGAADAGDGWTRISWLPPAGAGAGGSVAPDLGDGTGHRAAGAAAAAVAADQLTADAVVALLVRTLRRRADAVAAPADDRRGQPSAGWDAPRTVGPRVPPPPGSSLFAMAGSVNADAGSVPVGTAAPDRPEPAPLRQSDTGPGAAPKSLTPQAFSPNPAGTESAPVPIRFAGNDLVALRAQPPGPFQRSAWQPPVDSVRAGSWWSGSSVTGGSVTGSSVTGSSVTGGSVTGGSGTGGWPGAPAESARGAGGWPGAATAAAPAAAPARSGAARIGPMVPAAAIAAAAEVLAVLDIDELADRVAAVLDDESDLRGVLR